MGFRQRCKYLLRFECLFGEWGTFLAKKKHTMIFRLVTVTDVKRFVCVGVCFSRDSKGLCVVLGGEQGFEKRSIGFAEVFCLLFANL